MAAAVWYLLSMLFPEQELRAKLQGAGINLVTSLAGTLFSGLKDEVSLAKELDEELAKLERTKTRIKARLEDADQRRRIVDQHVKLWHRELDGFALDAEDLLDLVRTRIEAFREQRNRSAVPPNSRKRKRSWSDFLPSSVYDCSSSVPLWRFKWSVAKEVVSVNQRFEEICKSRRDLQERRGDGARVIEGPVPQMPKAGLLDSEEFVGMGNDRRTILNLLLQDNDDRAVGQPKKSKGKGTSDGDKLCLIAITGMGGSGKTTLVQSVYDEVKCFHKKIWIYVKREHGPERITKEMLESLGEKSRFCNFDTSLRQLMNGISGKKLLLVLDNVDDSFIPCWDSVRAALGAVASGSKVVVTTRSARVPPAMGATPHRLEGLSEADWLALFKAKVVDLDGHPELEQKAKKIARKCQMSPLAAKVLGSLIYNIRDAEVWESVLDEVLTDAEENLIRKTLITSYEQLPLRLKRCFQFCAIFPQGHDLDKDELAKCWAALGFMEEAKRPEAAGRRCFEDLVRLSFIEHVPGKRISYRMPGLMHDLARQVSEHQCVSVQKEEVQPSSAARVGARHAMLHCAGVNTEGELEKLLDSALKQASRLRTFMMLRGESRVCLNRLQADLFQKMRCLRVLDLSYTEICKIPNWIGELQLLRYLNLSRTLVSILPESVTSLRNLQTLNLSDCLLLHELPQETSNLTNLRHLILSQSHPRRSCLTSTPPEIGKLTGLQTLSRFIVGGRSEGCGLDQLQHLTTIKGELWLSKLENVDHVEDAQATNLSGKREIHTLTLQWTSRWGVPQPLDAGSNLIRPQPESSPATGQDPGSENSSSSSSSTEPDPYDKVQGHLIEMLHPPSYLKNLWIDNYYGAKPPEWISQMRYLETVQLSYCQHWESLIMLEGLTQLKDLFVEGLGKLAVVETSEEGCDKFQSLEKLTLLNMENLEHWEVHQDQMPNLKDLCFLHCPKLKEFARRERNDAQMLRSLVSLRLSHCHAWESLAVLEMLPQLKHLHVEQLEKVKVMKPTDPNTDKFRSLETLTLLNMPNLEEWFIQMPNLKELCFLHCPKLKEFDEALEQPHKADASSRMLTSLVSLRLSHCHAWKSLTVLEMLPQLKYLHIEKLQEVKVMKPSDSQLQKIWPLETLTLLNMENLEEWSIRPGQMPNLKELYFLQCPKLRDRSPVPASVKVEIKACSC